MFKKFFLLMLIQSLFLFAYAKDLQFSGYTSYKRYGGTMNLSADTVRNNRMQGVSGDLKIMLWATRDKYRGGYINGFVVAQSRIGRLRGNNFFSRVSRDASFYAPPRGRYFMTLTLSEYRYGRYEIVDYINYNRRESF